MSRIDNTSTTMTVRLKVDSHIKANTAAELSWYDNSSWHPQLQASTGLQRQKRDYVSIDHNDFLMGMFEACNPLYQELHSHKIS